MRMKQRGILTVNARRLNKKGIKVMPEAYSTAEKMLHNGDKISKGAAYASITEQALDENTSAVISLLKIMKNTQNGTDIHSITFVMRDKDDATADMFCSANFRAASGKKETEKVLKSPAGNRIIVSAYPKNAP